MPDLKFVQFQIFTDEYEANKIERYFSKYLRKCVEN